MASQVHHKKLAEVLRPDRPVVSARVVRSEVEIQPNVLLVRVEVDAVEPVYLQPPESRVWVHSFSTLLTRTAADGRDVRVSPIREGSGIEQNLEVGERYLFVLEADGEVLVRVEKLERFGEVRGLLGH
jgi:hypothetical protein